MRKQPWWRLAEVREVLGEDCFQLHLVEKMGEGDRAPHHYQVYLVLALLFDSSSPIPGYQGDKGPSIGSSAPSQRIQFHIHYNHWVCQCAPHPHDDRTKQGQGPPEAHSLIWEEWYSHRKMDYSAECNQSTQRDLQVIQKFTEARNQIPFKASSNVPGEGHIWNSSEDRDELFQVGRGRREGIRERRCVSSMEFGVAKTRTYVGE